VGRLLEAPHAANAVAPFVIVVDDLRALDGQELEDRAWMWLVRETYDPLFVRRPTTWLLREGWKLAGAISARAVPGKA
jgi:hypothetical protein